MRKLLASVSVLATLAAAPVMAADMPEYPDIDIPDVDYDKIDKLRGLEIVVVTTAPNDAHAYALLKRLGMPFKD